ncbi:uncharacterized protein [Dysidea avara]|uniref:uncharacterized protein isoform X2 n=1 Tax=Dysidea avara TaxID=196820 RepID=UPI0033344CD5
MNEGQSGNDEAVQTVLFTYSKPKNKRENSQRIPFYRNPSKTQTSLYQSRPANIRRAARAKTTPSTSLWSIEEADSETKPTKKCETSNTSFHSIFDDSWFPDDLELSFHNGQLDCSKLELSTCSMVPDINSAQPENTAQQNFYDLNISSKSDTGLTRKRTYRDFPDFTYKKPCFNK